MRYWEMQDPQWLADAHRLLRARDVAVGDLLRCIEDAVKDYGKRKLDHDRLAREVIEAGRLKEQHNALVQQLMNERQRTGRMLTSIGNLYHQMRGAALPENDE